MDPRRTKTQSTNSSRVMSISRSKLSSEVNVQSVIRNISGAVARLILMRNSKKSGTGLKRQRLCYKLHRQAMMGNEESVFDQSPT